MKHRTIGLFFFMISMQCPGLLPVTLRSSQVTLTTKASLCSLMMVKHLNDFEKESGHESQVLKYWMLRGNIRLNR